MNKQMLAIVEQGQVKLLEEISLPEGTKLLISPLVDSNNKRDESDWYNFSQQALNQAYEDDEPEYTLDSIKTYNQHYEAE